MAKVILEKDKKRILDVHDFVAGRMYREKITSEEMAKYLGLSRKTFMNRLMNGGLLYRDLLLIFERLGLEDHEILAVMKLRKERPT